MLPRPLFRCPETITPQAAKDMAQICDVEFRAVTGRTNKMPRSDAPVCCVSTAGIYGFWSLECNDPEIPKEQINSIVENICKWEGAPACPK